MIAWWTVPVILGLVVLLLGGLALWSRHSPKGKVMAEPEEPKRPGEGDRA